MQKIFTRRKRVNVSLVFSAIIFATIPFAIYSLLNSQNFDLRNLASEDQFSCTIHIPYVNPKTLDIEKNYQVHVYADFGNENIQSITVFNKKKDVIFSNDFTNNTTKISETFMYSPVQLGEEDIWGEIKTSKSTYACDMDRAQERVVVIEKNHPPEFLTDPYFSARPPSSTLTLDDTYEYVLEVADRDNDSIEYHYSFTPRADWLQKTVLENGKDGKLKLRFAGQPDKEGSYLANIFIHDGYNKHIVAQSWVISIGDESSEIPVVPEPRFPAPDYIADNEIIFEDPQITKVFPRENSYTTNPKETISANLIASNGGKIKGETIVVELNGEDITGDIETVKISEREILIRYTPSSNLKFAEHQIYIFFEDSNKQDTEKTWSFAVEETEHERTLLGFPINTVIIFGLGTLLVLFAISIPWMIYIAWKKDEPEDYKEIPIIKPEGQSSFQASFPPSFSTSSEKKEKE